MASVKDAFEDTLSDNLSVLKIILFAIPLYYSYYLFTTYKDNTTLFWWVAGITFMLLFGFIIKCTTNVMQGKDYILPSFNIFSIFWAAFKGLLAIGPTIALNTWLATLITSKVSLSVEWVDIAFKCIIWGIFISIILTGFVLYTKRQKISDAYNFKIISDSSINILIAVLFMVPILAIFNLFTVGFISYVIWVFLGLESQILMFFWCVAIVFNLSVIGDYLAQVEYENVRDE